MFFARVLRWVRSSPAASPKFSLAPYQFTPASRTRLPWASTMKRPLVDNGVAISTLITARATVTPAAMRRMVITGHGVTGRRGYAAGYEVRDRDPPVLRRWRVRSWDLPGLPRARRGARLRQRMGPGD